MTTEELIGIYEKHTIGRKKSKVYVANICRAIKEFCAIMQINDLDGFNLLNIQYSADTYISALNDKGNSANSIKTKLAMVKVFFKYLYNKQFIQTNIMAGESIQGEKKDQPQYEPNDIVTVMYGAKTEQDFVIRMLLYASGIRIEELTTLTVNNVSDGVVKVLGKGNKWREVQVFHCVTSILMKFIQKHNRTELVFTNETGGETSRENITKTMKTTARHYGIQNADQLSPHKFRHVYSESMLNIFNVPIDVVGANLGHSALGGGVASVTWQVYAKTSIARVREFIDRIESDADRRGGVGRFFKLDRNHTDIEEEYKKRFGS